MKTFGNYLIVLFIVGIIGYSAIGTGTRVNEIKKRAPQEMEKSRNWKVLRYEGFQYGSWGRHCGKVWYHVCNIDNPNIQYRVRVSLWGDELHYYYGSPEVLNRIDVKIPESK